MSSTSTQSPGPVGYGALIRGNANFRNLWIGQIISLLGDWFNLIASAALIAELSQSGFAVGGLFVVRMLAPFVVSPIAGVVADRYNRKRILILTDIIRAIIVLGFFLVTEPQHIWLLYTLTAIQLALSGFFFPTRGAILPELVSPGELGSANALSATTWSVMLALGAALGGIVSGTWGIYPAFAIDALTFILSAFFIIQIGYDPPGPPDASERTISSALRQYLDGLRYLGQHLDILVISLQKALAALFFTSGLQVIQVAIAKSIFSIGEAGGISLGLMFAIAGVGTGIGPIVARRFTGDRSRPLRVAILLGYLLSTLGMVITAPLFNFETVLLGTLLRGIGGGILWVFSTQLLLQLVPNHFRGRVFSTEFAFFTLMSAAGASLAGGGLDSSLGIAGTLWWMTGLTLIPCALWALWFVARARTMHRFSP
ncbi:MAG: MFS transporter [Acidobacteria bacterium]|nr:MFS transporter [Acidobacteriota bacterium]